MSIPRRPLPPVHAPIIQRQPMTQPVPSKLSVNGSKTASKVTRLIARPLAPPTRAPVEFVDSGSCLLNRVLGGGWALRRISNLVGDASSGKTLLAVEACANFMPLVKSPDDIRYVETESAYDEDYGRVIGMPEGVHPVDTIDTVEGFFADLQEFVTTRKGWKTPSLYVLDSLDAISDEDELKSDITKGTFGAAKAKKMSETFRRLVGPISDANCHLLIVSQLRDNIGVMFGEKKKRSGGTALNFYASQIVWLAELRKVDKQIQNVKSIIGTEIRARNKKCKVGGRPFCDADMTLWFNYGIDDEGSMLDWLSKYKVAEKPVLDDIYKQVLTARRDNNRQWLKEINTLLRQMVTTTWDSVDKDLLPPMRKYA